MNKQTGVTMKMEMTAKAKLEEGQTLEQLEQIVRNSGNRILERHHDGFTIAQTAQDVGTWQR